MKVYYNEIDPFACAWTEQLILAGLIPEGDIDNRSIKDVTANDVRGYDQCHWFNGIAGWSYALQLAGYQNIRCWSGSCPCQSYSTAGKQLGNDDERNLWPEFFRLIKQCQPECVIGEQVNNAIKFGWLDRVQSDLEGIGYAFGATVLGAFSVGAPHKRQRIYWGGYDEITSPWATPSSRDWKDTPGMSKTGTNPDGSNRERNDQLPRQVHGLTIESSDAPMERVEGYLLNPKFSLSFLQGFPVEWGCCGEQAIASVPRWRQSSSKPSCLHSVTKRNRLTSASGPN